MSDTIWKIVDKEWRYESPEQPKFEELAFYGPCNQTYSVTLPSLKGRDSLSTRWSSYRHTGCNTPLDVTSVAGLYQIELLQFLVMLFLTTGFGFDFRPVLHWLCSPLIKQGKKLLPQITLARSQLSGGIRRLYLKTEIYMWANFGGSMRIITRVKSWPWLAASGLRKLL